ncbi:MAG: DMT family transporter [Actinobacteria bacterium]|nr:MAG: DMT family transporter [Actinomycetota bacterium]
MRRLSAVDAMLLGAVLLWALNITVTKYVLEHGWLPLAYGTIRYFAAISIFWIYTWWRERSFRIARADWIYVGIAAAMIFVNQLCFVYSLEFARASTVSLLFGTTPMFVGLISIAFLHARLQRSFWIGAGLTLAGVGLIAAGAGGGLVSGWKGDLLAISLAVTWASYTTAIAPLMRRYSPYRISAVVLAIGWLPLALVSIPQISRQDFSFSGPVWLGFAYAVIGPLFLTNILWFTAVDRVGAPRATIFNNMQPFFGVLFALLVLSESIHGLEIAGGVLIFAGIAYERVGRQVVARVPTAE